MCTPRTENICETKEVISQSIKYKKVCKKVVNNCGQVVAVVDAIVGTAHTIGKRENQASHRNYRTVTLRPDDESKVSAIPLAHEQTLTPRCSNVVSEYCLNSPTVEETTVPIKQCYVTNKVDCVKENKKIPKKVCTPFK